MHKLAGGGASVQSDDRNDGYHAIVSDLLSLIEHVEASMKLIESAVAREAHLGNQEIAPNVVVLDDVTPRYVKANEVLNACSAGLGVVLHFLLDNYALKHRARASAGSDRVPAQSNIWPRAENS